jgi:phage terminase small subunit
MLTVKQEKFVQNILNGMTQRQAYKDAYNAENMKDETIDSEACILFKDRKVAERYQELLKEMEKVAVMSALEKRKLLKDMILNEKNSMGDRLKALDIDNKMSGEYIENLKVESDNTLDVTVKVVK